VCASDDDEITSLVLEWTGTANPLLVFTGASVGLPVGNRYVLTDDILNSGNTGKTKGGSTAMWEHRVDVAVAGGTALSLATSCSGGGGMGGSNNAPRLGHQLDFGGGNMFTVVGFTTASGRSQENCNTCFADDRSCRDELDQFFCPNPVCGVGALGSSGPFGAGVARVAVCVSSCAVECPGLPVDGTGVVSTSAKRAKKGVDECAVPQPFGDAGDEEHDHNTCHDGSVSPSGKSKSSSSNKGNKGRRARRAAVASTASTDETSTSVSHVAVFAVVGTVIVAFAAAVEASRSRRQTANLDGFVEDGLEDPAFGWTPKVGAE
jgi:hypothetical protein